jgi:hypothetical protein
MELKEITIAMHKTAQTLADLWIVKIIISLVVAVISNNHAIALYIFTTLVFIDLVTKWIAISHEYQESLNRPSDLASSIYYMNEARKAGKINSSTMKHRFGGKIILYLFLTVTSICVDYFANIAGYPQLWLPTVWGYLAITEAFSILENLQDASVEEVGDLLEILHSLNPFKRRA